MWVFGYGSLMWKPGFALAERRPARMMGYARTFCMRSIHHRGTPERPGLVLALDATEGAYCDGVALRVRPGNEEETLEYLRARELVSSAYLERRLPIVLEGGSEVDALCYVVDADHEQYCGGLDLEEQARIIAGATGGMGDNDEYLINTVMHLDEMGIQDPDLQWLARRVRNYHEVP